MWGTGQLARGRARPGDPAAAGRGRKSQGAAGCWELGDAGERGGRDGSRQRGRPGREEGLRVRSVIGGSDPTPRGAACFLGARAL